MTLKKNFLVTIFSATCAITACGGGGGGGSSASIVGVWDSSEDLGSDGFDEFYIGIDSKGSISAYDYAGDTYDDVANCYWIEKDYGIIEKVKDDQYTIIYEGDAIAQTATIDVTNSKMTITITGPDAQEPFTFSRSNKRASDFTPECDDSVGRSQGEHLRQKLQKKLI